MTHTRFISPSCSKRVKREILPGVFLNSAIINFVPDNRPRAALNAQLLRLNEGYRSAGIARYIYHLLLELPAAAQDIALDIFSTEPLAPERLRDVTVRTTRLPVHKPMARILW